MDGRPLRILQAEDVAGLRDEAVRAEEEGIEAVLVGSSPLGDPFVLLAGLSDAVGGVTLVARVVLGEDGRHPTLLAREATSLDLVDGGRTVLCFGPPFGEGLDEAIRICRAMWRDGTATNDGPVYPVADALNRPRPAGEGSPLIALDLTGPGAGARDEAGGSAALADMVVVRDEAGDGTAWRLERVVTDVETAVAEREEGRTAGLAESAVTGRHLPALNGLRGVAVIGVVAYHLQLGWAKGGYLGVDLFFVLSGFLITTLLLEEWAGKGRISLAAFWGRRARRLLPALFLVVVALAVYLVVNGLWGGAGANGLVDLSGLRGDAISTLLYVNNWHSIFVHQSYFAQFSTPSPLQHTWSLAIEEQFYLVWPLVLLVLLRYGRRAWRAAGVGLAVGLGILSSILMAVLFTPGADPSRVYYGTDTRLFDLMAGATIAFIAAARPQPNARARRTLHVVAPVAGVALLVFWVFAGTSGGLPTNFMFEGGFLVCAALAGLVVADARLVEPGGLARGLAWRPLHFIGTISYGIYLWHWPVIVYLNGARTGLSAWPLDLLRVAVTLALSTASYYLVERPIRLARLHGWVRYWGAPLAGVLSALLIVTATFPAVADPATVASTSRLPAAASSGSGAPSAVAGAGGFAGQVPIHLAVAPSPADPVRVMVLGDSVMHDASYGITAALGATSEADVATRTIDGFGLTTATNWRTSLPNLIAQTRAQLIVASWSWDQYGPTTPNALHDPAAYTALLRSAVATMLTPGNGVDGVIFTEFPQSGPIQGADGQTTAAYNKARTAGVIAWNNIARSMTKDFPGQVMYFPVADSVLLDGRYSAWLPPEGDPHAPKADWLRVRRLDKVHLCPEGSARFGAAILADMTQVFGLAPATGDWSQGSWTSDPNFNDPPGACPDDHPPGG